MVRLCCTHFLQLAGLHLEPEALSVGQGDASLGGGGLAGRRGGAVAHWPPPGHDHRAARLVLVQRALTGVNHPVRGGERTVDMVFTQVESFL